MKSIPTDYGWLHERYTSIVWNLSQEKIQNAIDIQPKVMEVIIVADGGHTTYMSSGYAKKEVWFLWDFQLNFDTKNIFTMGKSMIIFAFVNCPWVKNQSSRFTIDNNFFGSTYRAARYQKENVQCVSQDMNCIFPKTSFQTF